MSGFSNFPKIDPILDRRTVARATSLSLPTIWRMQQRGEFPHWQDVSVGRVGLRQSVLNEWLNGRRDWSDVA